jgi:cobalamin synthase
MKTGSLVFGIIALFFITITPIYWFLSYDPTGTAALILTCLLNLLICFYLVVTARRLPPQPQDDKEGEIADAAGEYGFFSPYSWWPLATAFCFGLVILSIVVGFWLMVIGAALGAVALLGFVFEYYRGEHAH